MLDNFSKNAGTHSQYVVRTASPWKHGYMNMPVLHYTNIACIVLHYSHDIKYVLLQNCYDGF
jgi:hypothetical protein